MFLSCKCFVIVELTSFMKLYLFHQSWNKIFSIFEDAFYCRVDWFVQIFILCRIDQNVQIFRNVFIKFYLKNSNRDLRRVFIIRSNVFVLHFDWFFFIITVHAFRIVENHFFSSFIAFVCKRIFINRRNKIYLNSFRWMNSLNGHWIYSYCRRLMLFWHLCASFSRRSKTSFERIYCVYLHNRISLIDNNICLIDHDQWTCYMFNEHVSRSLNLQTFSSFDFFSLFFEFNTNDLCEDVSSKYWYSSFWSLINLDSQDVYHSHLFVWIIIVVFSISFDMFKSILSLYDESSTFLRLIELSIETFSSSNIKFDDEILFIFWSCSFVIHNQECRKHILFIID